MRQQQEMLSIKRMSFKRNGEFVCWQVPARGLRSAKPVSGER